MAYGCESNANTDVANCGGCGNNCNTLTVNANGVSCNGSGACTYTTCKPGFFDCNGNKADGCEATGQGLGCCNGTTPAATGTPMIKHSTGVSDKSTPPQTIYYYDCYPLGTSGTTGTYVQQMADDAGVAAAAGNSSYPGPPITFTGTSTGCYNATAGGKVTINQYIECSQSASACVCWSWKFCCWSTATGACVACPAGVNENTPLCYPSGGGACTNCKAADFYVDNPSGYVDINTTTADSTNKNLKACYGPSVGFGDQPYN
jgi:hypothetical protein